MDVILVKNYVLYRHTHYTTAKAPLMILVCINNLGLEGDKKAF